MNRSGGRWLTKIMLTGFLALGFACATRLAPPEVDVEEMDDLSDQLAGEGLDIMRGYIARLRAVSDPLRLNGTELCKDENVLYLGVIVESVDPRVLTPLDRVRRLRGIDRNPTIVSVIADSPAARAGLQPNDVIRTYNGRKVIGGNLPHTLNAGSRRGPSLEVERAGKKIEVELPYTPVCTKTALFSPFGSLSTEKRLPSQVVVSRGLMDFVRSDDKLAILIAHEMAHLIIDHEQLSQGLEEQADRLSLELALRAGYDIRGAVEIWERLAVQRPWMIAAHPKAEHSWRERVYHGYVAPRTLLMPKIIAELESRYLPTTTSGEDSRRSSIPTQR